MDARSEDLLDLMRDQCDEGGSVPEPGDQAVPVIRWTFHAEITRDGTNWQRASETVETIDGRISLDIGHGNMDDLADGLAYLRIVSVRTT